MEMYSNCSIGDITAIINKHILSTFKNVLILHLIPFSPLHINYFIIAYHIFVLYNFRERNMKKHNFYKNIIFLLFKDITQYLQFHPKRPLLIHSMSEMHGKNKFYLERIGIQEKKDIFSLVCNEKIILKIE